MIRIWFFGTPDFASAVLRDILDDADFSVDFVVTQPDKPVGRGLELSPSPVKVLADARGIPVFQPESVRNDPAFLAELEKRPVEYFVVVAYGKILPNSVLSLPKKLPVNVHASILPKYRGASPIQACLVHGDSETGVTIMRMSEGMDEGESLRIERFPIRDGETAGSLFDHFSRVSGRILAEAVKSHYHHDTPLVAQLHEHATYCKKISKEDGNLDFSRSAKELYHLWQGYTPWPGTYTFFQGKRLRIESCSYEESGMADDFASEALPGTVLSREGRISVRCASGFLTLGTVKLEWKKSMPAADLVRGYPGFVGAVLTSE